VTGLLLFAKNAAAHRRANEWFESRQVHKTYEALTVATGADAFRDKALWTSRLLRGKKRAYESPLGKNAETSACVINQVKTAAGIAALWQLEPHTGRPHQLRYELARHGFPILGDRLYGSDQSCPDSRPAPFAQDRDNKKPDYNQQDEPLIALRCIRLAFHDCRDAESLDLPDAVTAPSLPRYLGLEEV
jgi:23S rRNA-/tRNA-specific pseudouridylate synthase